MSPATPSTSYERDVQIAQVALKGFRGITHQWQCTAAERRALLGGVIPETLENEAGLPEVPLSGEVLERISLLLGIYKALQELYPNHERANRRIRLATSEPPFEGVSAMAFMTRGDIEQLAQTRRYFDAKLGWM